MEGRKNIKVAQEEINQQKAYMGKIKEININKQKKFIVNTFGCQMSESDSEKIGGMLMQMGYSPAEKAEQADIIVFNTCCVREHAEEKIFSRLGQLKPLKQKNKDLIIAFGGCMAQQSHVVEKIKKSYRHVDIILGTLNVYRFPELLYNLLTTNKNITEIWDIDGVVPEGLPARRKEGIKAWVDIIYGCNNFCSYCIVPYVRGRERSREADDIIDEVKSIAEQGYKEVTLLGQNVNSYGLDFNQCTVDSVQSFPKLLEKISEIDGIERIRFMTSNPKDVSDELIKVMAQCKKICRHIHLPFQSGSTEILKKMNRKYTKEQYLDLVERVKKAVPEVSFTTDIIVGFPGETEEDFQDTLDVVKKVRFDLVYTFIYSKREGTLAAKITEQVSEETKKNRFDTLLETVYKIVEENNMEMIGKTEEILVEGASKNNEEFLTGRTSTNKIVNFRGEKSLTGKLVYVKIVSQHMWYFAGELI